MQILTVQLPTAQEAESGAYFAQYAMGNFKVGYGKSLYAVPLTDKNGNVTEYDTTSMGIEFAVNDQLSISYTKRNLTAMTAVAITDGATTNTKDDCRVRHYDSSSCLRNWWCYCRYSSNRNI